MKRIRLDIRRLMTIVAVVALLTATSIRVVPWVRKMFRVSETCWAVSDAAEMIVADESRYVEDFRRDLKQREASLKEAEAWPESGVKAEIVAYRKKDCENMRTLILETELRIEEARQDRELYRKGIWRPWTMRGF